MGGRPFSGQCVHDDVSAHEGDQTLDDGQAESGSLLCLAVGRVDLHKGGEEFLEPVFRDACARVMPKRPAPSFPRCQRSARGMRGCCLVSSFSCALLFGVNKFHFGE